VLLVAATGLCLAGTASAIGSSTAGDTAIPAGKISPLSTVSFQIPAPPGAMLDGHLFSADVTGLSCGQSVGPAGDDVQGPAGDDVCLFTLTFTPQAGVPPVTGEVSAGAEHLPLTFDQIEGADGVDFAFAYTPGSALSFTLAGAGYSQSYSFSQMKHLGPEPAALYSALPLGRGITDRTLQIAETDTATGDKGFLAAKVTTDSVSFFAPNEPSVYPPSPDEAFLDLGFTTSSQPGPGGDSIEVTTLTSDSRVELVAGGETLQAIDNYDDYATPLSGNYSFLVPDNLSSATIVVLPDTGIGYSHRPDAASHGPDTIDLAAATGSTSTTVPTGSSLPTGSLPTGLVGAPAGASNAAVIAGAGGGGGLVLVVVVPILIRRRRQKEKGEKVTLVASEPLPLPPLRPIGIAAPQAEVQVGEERTAGVPGPAHPPDPRPCHRDRLGEAPDESVHHGSARLHGTRGAADHRIRRAATRLRQERGPQGESDLEPGQRAARGDRPGADSARGGRLPLRRRDRMRLDELQGVRRRRPCGRGCRTRAPAPLRTRARPRGPVRGRACRHARVGRLEPAHQAHLDGRS
jgi:hypothetical protein